MRRILSWFAFLLPYFPALFAPSQGSAEVATAHLIDKTNWAQAQGLLPDPVLAWVKEAKIVLEIGELSYRPRDCFPAFVLEGLEKNAGRYELDQHHWIVEAETGQRAEHIVGVPFPEIDPADPEAGEKIMHNKKYAQYSLGDAAGSAPIRFVGPAGYERDLFLEVLQTHMEGNPKYAERPNPTGLLQQQIVVVRSPYDMAGVAVMTWRFRDPDKQDICYGYAPAIRRVRRMSPANRSDALFGSNIANDDIGLYDGKMSAMEWRLLGRREALVPFWDPDPARIERNGQGAWEMAHPVKATVYGYEREGWQGAPWAPVNWVWVKRPVHVIEMRPKDPYYNYGVQHLWISAEAYSPVFKVIRDRSGAHWKTLVKARMAGESEDKAMRLTILGDTIYVDERSKRATLGPVAAPEISITYFANIGLDNFSLAGFQRFCK